MSKIPITVFTGFLGAGKTTIILKLVQQARKEFGNNYRISILKNEFGDSGVDSTLFAIGGGRGNNNSTSSNSDSNVSVSEMINGCICCVLVGQMEHALEEMRDRFKPDRIIVETSGSAFPAPIAWQIRQMEFFALDSIITVIDCVNFRGYEDTSYTAKMQAQVCGSSTLLLLGYYRLTYTYHFFSIRILLS